MWQDEIIPLIRVLIDDLGPTFTYDDSRLEYIAIAGAHMMLTEVDFKGVYSVSIAGETITPDPTDSSDVAFINLTALKSACIILQSEAKTASRLGIKIVDGPSTVDGKGRLDYFVKAADDMNRKYAKAKLEYLAGNSKAGHAVMTPFTNENVPVQNNFR